MSGVSPREDDSSTDTNQTLAGPEPSTASSNTNTQHTFSKPRPWLVAAGALALTMPTYGLMSAWGLFQVYWAAHQLKDSAAAASIPWIGSLFGFLGCLFGLLSGVVLDSGGLWLQRGLLVGSCAVYWAALLALAWCSTYGTYMGCFIVAGVASAVPTTAAFVVVDHSFKGSPKKSTAIGIVSTGAPLGGLLASLSMRSLFERYTWKASMFWLSSMVGVMLAIGCLLVLVGGAMVQAEKVHSEKTVKTTWDLSHFADRGFLMFTACVFVFEFVLYTQWGSLPFYATSVGVGDVFYIQMTYNLGAIPGRTLPSWLASRLAKTNKSRVFDITLAMTALTILTVFVVWLPFGAKSAPALYIVALFMGVGTGSFVPLSATCLSELCSGRGYGKWLGSCYAVVGFASLIGNPVNQALIKSTGPRFSVAFQGILLVLAFVLCVIVRMSVAKSNK